MAPEVSRVRKRASRTEISQVQPHCLTHTHTHTHKLSLSIYPRKKATLCADSRWLHDHPLTRLVPLAPSCLPALGTPPAHRRVRPAPGLQPLPSSACEKVGTPIALSFPPMHWSALQPGYLPFRRLHQASRAPLHLSRASVLLPTPSTWTCAPVSHFAPWALHLSLLSSATSAFPSLPRLQPLLLTFNSSGSSQGTLLNKAHQSQSASYTNHQGVPQFSGSISYWGPRQCP